MNAFIDSDVLIWHLRGEPKALKFLKRIRDEERYELCVGAMQRAEVVFFMRPGDEEGTELLLSQFKTTPVDQAIVAIAALLFRQWNPSHGIDTNDALLAASAIKLGGTIFGLNKKHYPMPEVLFQKAW